MMPTRVTRSVMVVVVVVMVTCIADRRSPHTTSRKGSRQTVPVAAGVANIAVVVDGGIVAIHDIKFMTTRSSIGTRSRSDWFSVLVLVVLIPTIWCAWR